MRECVSEGVSEGVECGAGLILHAFLCTYSVSKCSVLVCVVCDPQAGQFVQESLYAAAMTLFALEQYEEGSDGVVRRAHLAEPRLASGEVQRCVGGSTVVASLTRTCWSCYSVIALLKGTD